MTQTYATLQTIPIFPVEVRLIRRGGSAPVEDAALRSRQFRSSASRQGGKYETRAWRITFGPESLSVLLLAFDSALGSALPMNWVPPPPDDGATIPVRVLEGSFEVRHGPGVYYEADWEIEEVI